MELTWIITAILGILLIYLMYSLSKKSTNYWTERGVPQVKNALPLFGHMLSVISGRNTLIERINSMYKELDGKKFGGYYMFTNPMLVVRDPELINQIVIKDFSSFEDRNYAMDEKLELMSAGLANLTGEKWRVLRHKLTPTFTSGKLKIMFREIKECSGDVVKFLNGKKGKDIDIRDILFKYTINVTGSTAFGMKVDALNEETEKSNLFLQNSKNFFAPSLIMQLKLLIAFSAPKVKDFLKLSLANKGANEFFPKIVQDLINYRKENGTRRNDFLQLMLDQKEKELSYITSAENSKDAAQVLTPEEDYNVTEEPDDLELLHHLKNLKFDKTSAVFSDHIIAAQTFLFISAGTETTSAVLSFALYELAVNKDIQKRLQDEIDSVLACDGFTYEAIKKMTYLEQVINEILRLRPPGGIVSRVCTQDYKIPGTEVVIPKGVLVHIPVQAIHKDPQYFPDPETFNPDRFQDMDAIPKNVFYPFGGGPRICLAMRLAMLEMKIFLADALSNYSVVLSERTQTPLVLNKKSILQHVIGGIWVRFESRNTSRK